MKDISFNFGVASLSRLVIGGISLVIVVFLTRYLGPAGYGDYNIILAYLFLFTTLADLGLYTILTREISKPGADEVRIAGNIFTLRLFLVLAGAIAANLIVFLLPYSQMVKIGVVIASGYMIFSSLSQVMMGIFQKHLKIYLVSIADLISRVTQLGLVIILVTIKAPFLFFIGVISISEIIHFIIIFLLSRRLVRINFLFDKKYWVETIKVAIPIAISLVFVLIYFKIDTLMLSLMKPSYDVGVYSVAYRILEFAIFFPAIYLGLVMPLLSKFAVSDHENFKIVFRNTFNKLSLFGWPIVGFLYAASDRITALIGGGEFYQSSAVLKILSLAVLVIFFGNLGGHALIALNLQKKGMWIYLSGMVLNLTGNLILIPRYTYFAAAWTTVSTEILITVLMFVVIRKHIKVAPEFKIFSRAFIASLGMTGVVLALNQHNILVLIFVGAITYFSLAYILGAADKKDLKNLLFFKGNL